MSRWRVSCCCPRLKYASSLPSSPVKCSHGPGSRNQRKASATGWAMTATRSPTSMLRRSSTKSKTRRRSRFSLTRAGVCMCDGSMWRATTARATKCSGAKCGSWRAAGIPETRSTCRAAASTDWVISPRSTWRPRQSPVPRTRSMSIFRWSKNPRVTSCSAPDSAVARG